MRLKLILASTAIAVLLPAAASAQTSCERQRENRVAGTVAGAGIGAVLGSQLAGHGARTEGSVIGGVAGAIIGNQAAKPREDCVHAYGYFDNSGYWHANAIARRDAYGYYDRNGAWVEGMPNGYYDSRGVWVADNRGYWDASGRWVPPSVVGFYDANEQWVPVQYAAAPPPPVPPRVADDWAARRNVDDRANRIQERIISARDDGILDRHDAGRFLDTLGDIRAREARMPHPNGGLLPDDESRLQARLDDLSSDVRSHMRG